MNNIQYPIRLLAVLIIAIAAIGCAEKKFAPTAEQLTAHQDEVADWYDNRIADLTGHNGYMNLAGLYWLKDGINSFGSDASNDIVFPDGKISAKAGFFMLRNGVVSLVPTDKTGISIYGTTVAKETNVFHPDSASAQKQLRGSVTKYGTLEWYVIRRDDKLGIRLRDLENPALAKFKGVDRYPVDYSWKVAAKFEAAPEGKTIDITNVLGQTTPQPSIGSFVFNIDGKDYRLDTTGNGKQLFVVFADSTTGNETYPSGRFVYVDRPDSTGTAFIDFNKSYNPPCAFTEFATCPLPTKQNTLPIAIRAGEKNFDHKILTE